MAAPPPRSPKPARALRNATTGVIVAPRVRAATAPLERAIGFLDRRAIDPAEGLWFERCGAVHTVGMRARIDVVFLDRERTVVRVIANAGGNRLVRGGPAAAVTVELAPGVATAHVRVGDTLELE